MTPARRREIHDALVRFADGDRGAFRPAFDALWPVLLAFTARALPTTADAEDAAQRALLQVFARIADLDPARDAVAWALTVAAYEVMTVRKQRARRREVAEGVLVALADATPGPEARVAASELADAVHAVIGELGERDRLALAELLGERARDRGETARKRRFRALERLRAAWRRIHG